MKKILTVAVAMLLLAVGCSNTQQGETSVQPTKKTEQKTDQTNKTQTSQSTNQTSNQIAGWKTYTNTKYGYTIQYPPSWEATPGSDPKLAGDFFTGPNESDLLSIGIGFASPASNGPSCANALGQLITINTASGSFMECVLPNDLVVYGDSTFLSNAGNKYAFTASWADPTGKAQMLKIISTFKFIK